MTHPSVYRQCASEVKAQILGVRRTLYAYRANENWDQVEACEREIDILVEQAHRFRRKAFIATLWPFLIMLLIALIVAALAALAVL